MIPFLSILTGWIVQGFIGLGSGIISTAILLFFYNAKEVVVSLSVIALLGTFLLTVRNYNGKLYLKEVTVVSVFSLFGAAIGSYLLEILKSQIIEVIFGSVIIATGIYDYFSHKKQSRLKLDKNIFGIITGLSGGIISGLIGGAGPIYAFFLNQTLKYREDFKFVISFIFLILNIERVLFYLISTDLKNFFSSDILIPGVFAVFIGVFLGDMISGKISNETFKKTVSFSIVLSGFYFILNGISTL